MLFEHRRLARCSVYPSGPLPLPARMDWGRFLALAREERTAAIVYRNFVSNGQTDIPSHVLENLRGLHSSLTARNVLRMKRFADVAGAFHRAHLPLIPLKGMFLARYVYPDPGMRDMSDVDALIRPQDAPVAHEQLTTLGYRPMFGINGGPEPGDSTYLNSRVYTEDNAVEPLVIHLHWHLVNASVPLYMYRDAIDLDSVFREARPLPFAGTSIQAMAPHHLLVYLAEHAMKHSFEQLIFLSDIAQVIQMVRCGPGTPYSEAFPELDWNKVLETARAWRLSQVLYYTMVGVRDVLGVPVPRDVMNALGNQNVGLDGRWMVRSLRRNRRWQGLSILGYLSLLPQIREKMIFVSRFLMPPGMEMERFGKKPTLGAYLRRSGSAVRAVCGRLGL